MRHYSGDGSGLGFEFDYPEAWNLIGGYHEVATHLRTLMVALGLGDFDLACTGSFPGTISCEDYKWTVPSDGVVFVYRMEEWPQGPVEPYPSPQVQPGDEWVQIDGRDALYSHTDGIMRWDMLGTPEVIEARYGSDVTATAPQEISAVIDSWHWRAPTATARPSPITTGSGSNTYEWQLVGRSQASVYPKWAPDGNHLLVDMQAANEFDRIDVLDRAGNSVANLNGVMEPFWLSSEVAVAHDGSSMPGTSGSDRSQFHTVSGSAIRAADGDVQPINLPCCFTLPNGHGAVAVTRFLQPETPDLARPKFVVWQDGAQSDEHDGVPVAWDLAGDKLAVIHPTEPNFHEYDGWLEVLSWPDLTPIFQDDPQNITSEAGFDPSGSYASYSYLYRDSSQNWHTEIHVIDLTSDSLAAIPVEADGDFIGGDYAWNDQGQLLVTTHKPVLYTYAADGSPVGQQPLPSSTTVGASADGRTLLLTKYDEQSGNLSGVSVIRNGQTQVVTLPFDNVGNVALSPDGSQLFAGGYSATDDGYVGYLADIP